MRSPCPCDLHAARVLGRRNELVRRRRQRGRPHHPRRERRRGEDGRGAALRKDATRRIDDPGAGELSVLRLIRLEAASPPSSPSGGRALRSEARSRIAIVPASGRSLTSAHVRGRRRTRCYEGRMLIEVAEHLGSRRPRPHRAQVAPKMGRRRLDADVAARPYARRFRLQPRRLKARILRASLGVRHQRRMRHDSVTEQCVAARRPVLRVALPDISRCQTPKEKVSRLRDETCAPGPPLTSARRSSRLRRPRGAGSRGVAGRRAPRARRLGAGAPRRNPNARR